MKTSLTALALAVAASAVQAQQDPAHDQPEPQATATPKPLPAARPAPVPPELPPLAPPVPPEPLVPDLGPLIAEGGLAGRILSHERVVKGAPYCAEALHETVQPLSDGNRIVHQQTSQLCRDGEGRTRQEVERQGRRFVYLRDPVSGENWLLEPDRKVARYLGGGPVDAEAKREHAERMREYNDKMRDYSEKMREYGRKVREWAREHGERVREAVSGDESRPVVSNPKPPAPPAAPRPPQAVVIAPGDGPQDMRVIRIETPTGALPPMSPLPVAVAMRMEPLTVTGENFSHSTLPAREVDGLKLIGARTTWTIPAGKIGNEKPILGSREVWTSPELNLTVSSVTKDPRSGDQSYQLRNIRRAEPDAALMRVPADFQKNGLPGARKSRDGKDAKDGKQG